MLIRIEIKVPIVYYDFFLEKQRNSAVRTIGFRTNCNNLSKQDDKKGIYNSYAVFVDFIVGKII